MAVFALAPMSDASAKARHVKADSDGSGLYKPPAPETKPLFVMVSPPPKLVIASTADSRPAAGPTGSAMGHEAVPAEPTRPLYPTRPVENLRIPLLFR